MQENLIKEYQFLIQRESYHLNDISREKSHRILVNLKLVDNLYNFY